MKAWIGAMAIAGVLAMGRAEAVPMVYGQGAQNCGVFVGASEASRQGDQASVYPFMVWMSGYVSYASGESGIEYFQGLDTKSSQLWLENYCRAKPMDKFVSAVLAFMQELLQRQPK